MELITEVFINSDIDHSSVTFFCNYPFSVNKDELFNCSSFILHLVESGKMDFETFRIIDDCTEVDFISHKIDNNIAIRTIWIKCPHKFPYYKTHIKDDVVVQKTKEQCENEDL